MDDESYDPEAESISEEEQEHDSRIAAKMHLFLERMVGSACTEEGIDNERATDLMLCAAVQMYVENVPATPKEIAVLCRSIAEGVAQETGGSDVLH